MIEAVTSSAHVQPALDDLLLARHLSDTTFCVVDLETTGSSPAAGSAITEIGAVKVRGGEVLGEFATLVNPDETIPAYITVLTGITDAMVIDKPRIEQVLPSFLEFARGCVLVAHNAPFDVGFLKHDARRLDLVWPGFEVIDTVVLARRALLRDEVPNHKLGTLAARFSSVTPDHRALTDARATVDVLHALFERLGSLGVTTLEELASFTSRVSAAQRRKRHLADGLPDAPGVYLFRGRDDEVLYVGTSVSLRRRVRSYFTESETRSRMGEMVALTERVQPVVCATPLEAQVRELRLIAAHRPPFNRRSKFPEKVHWLKLTREPWPRVSIVTHVLADDADYIGPFGRRDAADSARTALHEVFGVRQCTGRLARRPRGSVCALAEIGPCLAPCDGRDVSQEYDREVAALRAALADPTVVVETLRAKLGRLSADQRYEDAAVWRDRLGALLRGIDRTQRLRQLTDVDELVAAAPHDAGWQIHVVRRGRLVAAGVMPPGVDHVAWVEALVATAEQPRPGPGPAPAALVEETEAIIRWLATEGVRMVRGAWWWPLAGAGRHLAALADAARVRT